MGVMVAGPVFLAVVLLAARDQMLHQASWNGGHAFLKRAVPCSDDEFLAAAPHDNSSLLLEIRRAVADYFAVSPEQVPRHVDLKKNLNVDDLEPGFQFQVVNSVVALQIEEPIHFPFSMREISTLDEIADAIEKVLKEARPEGTE